MDINKVQKFNEMAQNLKKHNLMSKEDAIGQAEKIYGNENDFTREEVHMQTTEYDELRKEVRKLSFAMKDVITELNETKTKLEKLQKELDDVRVGNNMVQRRTQTSETNGNPQTGTEQPKRDTSKPIDRNNVAPKDVSIDKFFYFGK